MFDFQDLIIPESSVGVRIKWDFGGFRLAITDFDESRDVSIWAGGWERTQLRLWNKRTICLLELSFKKSTS